MIQPAVVRAVRVSDDLITMSLEDGRELSAPTAWSQRTRPAVRRQSGAATRVLAQWQISKRPSPGATRGEAGGHGDLQRLAPGCGDLRDPLVRHLEQAAGIPIGQPHLRQGGNGPAHRRRGQACARSASALRASASSTSARASAGGSHRTSMAIDDGGTCRNVAMASRDHRLDRVEGPGLREHARQRWHLHRPPAAGSPRHRHERVSRPGHRHHPFPSSPSSARLIARAVSSLISACRGITTSVAPTARSRASHPGGPASIRHSGVSAVRPISRSSAPRLTVLPR